jgi:undecaprenyl-diphosphatase
VPLYQALVLAVIQGLTEFLPVSSTAHLTLFPWLLGWRDPGLTFDVALHAGTLFAVLLYFWRTWVEMISAAAGFSSSGNPASENRRLFWYLIIGTLPAGLVGFKFERAAEETLRKPWIVGAALILVALFMWAAERVSRRDETLSQVTLLDSIVVGVSQAVAVIPGVSRSGITMSTGLFRRMTRETAARFSFLLSTPIIAGAALKKLMEIRHEGLAPEMRLPFVVGIVVSSLVGYAVIAWFIRYLERRTFQPFIVYRLALGAAVLAVYIWTHGVLKA